MKNMKIGKWAVDSKALIRLDKNNYDRYRFEEQDNTNQEVQDGQEDPRNLTNEDGEYDDDQGEE